MANGPLQIQEQSEPQEVEITPGAGEASPQRDKRVFVTVSPEMERAGLHELRYGEHAGDDAYLVRSIYMAMEYERLDLLGELAPLTDDALQAFIKDQG